MVRCWLFNKYKDATFVNVYFGKWTRECLTICLLYVFHQRFLFIPILCFPPENACHFIFLKLHIWPTQSLLSHRIYPSKWWVAVPFSKQVHLWEIPLMEEYPANGFAAFMVAWYFPHTSPIPWPWSLKGVWKLWHQENESENPWVCHTNSLYCVTN